MARVKRMTRIKRPIRGTKEPTKKKAKKEQIWQRKKHQRTGCRLELSMEIVREETTLSHQARKKKKQLKTKMLMMRRIKLR